MDINVGDIPGAVAGGILLVSVTLGLMARKRESAEARRSLMFRSMCLLVVGQSVLFTVTVKVSEEGVSVWNLAMICIGIGGIIDARPRKGSRKCSEPSAVSVKHAAQKTTLS